MPESKWLLTLCLSLLLRIRHKLIVRANVQDVHQHLSHFLANKRKRPCEDVHEVGQPVWVGGTVELSDVHHIVLILQHCRLIVVHIKIVGGREDGDETWEASCLAFAVHPVPSVLSLVRPNDGEKVVLL